MADREKDRRAARKSSRSRSRSRSRSKSRSRSPRTRPIRRSRSREADRGERRPFRPDIGKRLSAIANDGEGQRNAENRRQSGPPPRRENIRQGPPGVDRTPGTQEQTKVKIDREKTCPLLLRVFYKVGAHHRPDEYARGKTPANELQIYTWKDATLKELTSLVKEVKPETRKKGTYFDFAIVFPDVRRGGYFLKDIGTTCSGTKLQDDNIPLYTKKFQIGDFIDISITPPRERRDRI